MLGGVLATMIEEVGETFAKKSIKKIFTTNPFDELGKLKNDIRYKTGEFNYFGETDNLGRLENFDTKELKFTERSDRLPHNGGTPGKIEGDHAGHMFGDRFGGSPELDNLVSQASNVNLSKFKKLENQWAKAIESGKKVEVKIKINYNGNELRPSSFDIEFIIDGNPSKLNILNK